MSRRGMLRTRFPQQLTQINKADPLTQGLVRLVIFIGGQAFDLVTGTFLTKVGTGIGPKVAGNNVGLANASESDYWTMPIRTEVANLMTMGWVGAHSGGTTPITVRDASSSGGTILFWRNSGWDLRVSGTDYTGAGTFNTGILYAAAIATSATTAIVYVDGLLVVNGGAPGGGGLSTPWYIHQNGLAANGALATSIMLPVWDRTLSAVELAAFTRNPSRLLAPPRRLKKTSGIAFDAAGNSGDIAAASSYSGSASWSGTNRLLAVDVSMLGPGVTVSSMTYGGAACTLVGVQSTITSFGRVEQWRICSSDSGAPAAGSNTLAVTLSGSLEFAVEWASYTGVHQTSPTEGFNSAQATNAGSATDASVSVTSVADNCWVHAAVVANDTSITAGNTSRNNVAGTLGSGANEDNGAAKTPPGAVTMSYSGMGITTTWAIAGYAIRPLAASGGSVITAATGTSTTSTLAGSSTAASALTGASGASTTSSLAGASSAVSALTQASGTSTTSTLTGVGGSVAAITAASGSSATSTLAGSSSASTAITAGAGASSTSVLAGASVAAAAITQADGSSATGSLVGSAGNGSIIAGASGGSTTSTLTGSSSTVAAITPVAGSSTVSTLLGGGGAQAVATVTGHGVGKKSRKNIPAETAETREESELMMLITAIVASGILQP